MVSQSTSLLRLNEYIHIYIQTSGLQYVVDNYIDLREGYYNNKDEDPCIKEDTTNESRE